MKKIFFIIPLILISCSKNDIKSIVININQSEQIDLFKGEYTVRFMQKKDLKVIFKISKIEINEIKETYKKENIKNYKSQILVVNDKPIIMPATDIKYTIDFTNGSKQVFTIRTDNVEDPLNFEKFKALKVFIYKINYILKQKKEIQNLPKSDYLYL